MENEIYWWCWELIEDVRDFKAENVFWSNLISQDVSNIKQYSLIDFVRPNNQWQTPRCTNYSAWNNLSIQNNFERNNRKQNLIEVNSDYMWDNCIKDYPKLFWPQWWYLRETLLSIQKNWYIDKDKNKYKVKWFAVIQKNIDSLKNAIYLSSKSFLKWVYTWCDVFTTDDWSNNFTYCKKTWKLYVDRKSEARLDWHCISLCGWDDNIFWEWKWWFQYVNSYWEQWWFYKNWTWYIPYEEISSLYWPFIIYDTSDLVFIFKDVSNQSPYYSAIKYVFDNQIMNWYNSEIFWIDDKLTLEQFAIIKQRCLNSMWVDFQKDFSEKINKYADFSKEKVYTRWEIANFIYNYFNNNNY